MNFEQVLFFQGPSGEVGKGSRWQREGIPHNVSIQYCQRTQECATAINSNAVCDVLRVNVSLSA